MAPEQMQTAPDSHEAPLLATEGLVKQYRRSGAGGGSITALQDAAVQVWPGQSVGIVGESGSGKSTLLRQLLRLEPPTSGQVRFRGTAISSLGPEQLRRFRRDVQAVFQDPRSSLNPREPVWRLITEPAALSSMLSRSEQMRLAEEMLELVGLPSSYIRRRPGEMSGGECQRVAIARALSCQPAVVLLDEPVTSLDASLRGLVLNLLHELARERGCTYVVVSHDVTAIYYLTDYLYVLYRGNVVEEGPTVDIVSRPLHPYTKMLVGSIHSPLAYGGDEMLRDERPGACPFLSRCPDALPSCAGRMPPTTAPDGLNHQVKCYLWLDQEEVHTG